MLTSRPPVIRSPRASAPPAGPRPARGASSHRESRFEMERGSRPGVPWLAMLLLLGGAAAGTVWSARQDFMLGQLASPVFGLFGLHGLWRGGFRKIVMLPVSVGTIVLLAAQPDFADGLVQRMGWTPSGMTQLATCALTAAVVFAVASRLVGFVRNRFIMKRPLVRATDRFVGTGVGLVEGLACVLLVCWSAVALEPQASRVLFSPSVPVDSPQYRFAEKVVEFTGEVDGTPLRPIVRDANPLREVPAIRKILDGAADGRLDLSGLDPEVQAQVTELLRSVDPAKLRQLREMAGQVQGAGR